MERRRASALGPRTGLLRLASFPPSFNPSKRGVRFFLMQGSYRDAAKAATSILLKKREQLALREKRNRSHLSESRELQTNQAILLLGYNRDQEFSSVSV